MTWATMRLLRAILATGLLTLSSWVSADQPRYTLGIFPHLPPLQIEQRFTPIVTEFERVLQTDIAMVTSTTMERFAERLDRGEFDIVFIQPFDYIRVAKLGLYQPLARVEQPLQALFLVRPDSPIHSIDDLRGKRIAMPPRSSATSRLSNAELIEAGLNRADKSHVIYATSHSSCMQMLYTNRADSCATVSTMAEFISRRLARDYRVIHRSEELPHVLFAISPRHAQQLKPKLVEAIIGWGKTTEGKQLLQETRFKKFIAANDRDYDPVRHHQAVLNH